MTTPLENAKAAADTVCSVCNAPMPDGASRCDRCGATHGQENQCPFCKAVTEPQAHADLRFACPACGAPRVHVRDKGFKPSKAMVRHLGKARSARSSQLTWKVAGVAALGFGILATLLLIGVAMIANPPVFALLMAGLVTTMPYAFAALSWRNGTARAAELKKELDDAWLEAARALARSRQTLTAPQLGEALGIDEAAARDLAARLGASSDVSTDVTDSGDLALSIRVPERVRVEESSKAEPPAPSTEVVEQESPSAENPTDKARS